MSEDIDMRTNESVNYEHEHITDRSHCNLSEKKALSDLNTNNRNLDTSKQHVIVAE